MLGCGQGVVCSAESSPAAQCDRCDFDSSLNNCGSYVLPETSTNRTDTECIQGPVALYTGTHLSFTGSNVNYPLLVLSSLVLSATFQTDNVHSVGARNKTRTECLNFTLDSPVRAPGFKNGPAPFPGRKSYKATKPGLALSVVYLSMFYCIVVY